MNERQSQILKAAVEGFIKSGEPVSSGWLFGEYDFGIKPAMIRIELENLTDMGLLEHPYHSAGRVPTDAGYEFFVNQLLQESGGPGVLERSLADMLSEHSWDKFLHGMSRELGLLGVLTDFENTYKEGISDLISNLEWQSRDEVESVISDFEEIDKRLQSIRKKIGENPEIYIGKKSPITKSENLSVIIGRYDTGGGEVLLVGVGPKRMDYKKIIKVFKNI